MANVCSVITASHSVMTYLKDERCERCEHVHAGEAVVAVHTETDTFGPVNWMAVCQACHDESQNSIALDPCHDCGEKIPEKDMRQWKWFDFYAPQGDEPLYVCIVCWDMKKHQDRMNQDDRDRDEEFYRLFQ